MPTGSRVALASYYYKIQVPSLFLESWTAWLDVDDLPQRKKLKNRTSSGKGGSKSGWGVSMDP